MSRANRRLQYLLDNDKDFHSLVKFQMRKKFYKRIHGHVLSEAAHYLNRAAEFRREGKFAVAKSYVVGARSILKNGTNWTNVINQPRIKLP